MLSPLTDVSRLLPTEYLAICQAVAIGFAVMGFLGYFVKLVSFCSTNPQMEPRIEGRSHAEPLHAE